MVKTKHFICSFAVIAVIAFMAMSCGGGSSSTTAASDTTGGAITGGADDTSSAVSLKSTDAINADISYLDLSQSSTQASLNKSVSADVSLSKSMGEQEGDDSMAGCVTDQLKSEAIRMGKEIRIFQCYISAMQDNFSNFTIPDGSYSYYEILPPASETQFGSMKAKGGKNVSSSGTLEVMLCEGGVQMESFAFTSDGVNTITAAVKHHFKSEGSYTGEFKEGDEEYSDAEKEQLKQAQAFDEWGSMDISVTADSAAIGSIDNINEVDYASVTGHFDGGWGKGDLVFIYDEDGGPTGGVVNTVAGSHNASFGSGDAMTAYIFGAWNTSEGTAKYSASGSFPGISGSLLTGISGINASATYCPIMDECDVTQNFASGTSGTGQSCAFASPDISCVCMQAAVGGACDFTQTGTESFTIASGPSYKVEATSIFADAVSASALPTSVVGVTKNFGSYAWDCTAPSGASFVQLQLTDAMISSCKALEADAFDVSDKDSCQQDKQQSDQSETGQIQQQNQPPQ